DMCDTPYAVLLNSDVAADSDWVTPLLDYMKAHSECGACQPKILSYRDRTKFEYAGAAGGYIDRNGYPYCRGRIMDSVETDCGQYDTTVDDLFWATGAAMMVSVEAYRKAGGLDEAFFAHMEEIDLCWRMQRLGYSIAAVPQSHVYHLGGASLDASNPRKTMLNFRNSLLMLYKNLPHGRTRTATLHRRRLLDTLAWAQFVARGKWGHAGAILRAHSEYRRMKKAYEGIESATSDLLHTRPRRPNLLIQYYLRGRKKFSDLK
ncbi:MAG: glycosyltransferase family 2 protein, partial [Paramuribaculum sp.]|nr:glycosyltransferase family 2 protein [Paramuribaculum sp.]